MKLRIANQYKTIFYPYPLFLRMWSSPRAAPLKSK